MEHALVMVLTPLSDVKAGDIVTIGALEGRVALRGENLVIETAAPSGPFVLDASDQIFVQRPLTVGMAATTSFNGDSYPCSVKAFSPSGHRVEVTRMRTRGPGLFTETDRVEVYTRRADGSYRQKGYKAFSLTFGRREHQLAKEL